MGQGYKCKPSRENHLSCVQPCRVTVVEQEHVDESNEQAGSIFRGGNIIGNPLVEDEEN